MVNNGNSLALLPCNTWVRNIKKVFRSIPYIFDMRIRLPNGLDLQWRSRLTITHDAARIQLSETYHREPLFHTTFTPGCNHRLCPSWSVLTKKLYQRNSRPSHVWRQSFHSRLRLCEDNQKFHVVNHTINCPIHFITSNWNTFTLLTNYVRWPSTVASDAMTRTLTTWSFLKGSSYTSGYASQTSQRTQPVKNKDKTRIILLSRIQKLTVSTLNGGHWLPPLTQ